MLDVKTQQVVACAVFVILFCMVAILCFVPVPKENHDIFVTVVSVVTGSAVTVVAYYFGSSSSSKSKDETISKMATSDGTGT